MPKRAYHIQQYYAVFCESCNEDIAVSDGDSPTTREEAEKIQRIHEAWHKREDDGG